MNGNGYRVIGGTTKSLSRFDNEDSTSMVGLHQRQLWVLLSIIWWLGGIAVWIGLAWDGDSSAANSGNQFLTFLFVCLISASLRLPTITKTTKTEPLQDHWVWLLSFSANINWLGMIALHSHSLSFLIVLSILWLASEIWLGLSAWHNGRLQLFFNAAAGGYDFFKRASRAYGTRAALWSSQRFPADDASTPKSKRLEREFAENPFSESDCPTPKPTEIDLSELGLSQPQLSEPEEFEREADECADSAVSSHQIRQTMEDGYDVNGKRYLAGTVHLSWASGQNSQTVILGFVPALSTEPVFDSEADSENLSVRTLSCTPAGIRLAVKRTEPLESAFNQLEWYATEQPMDTEKPNGFQTQTERPRPPLP